MIEHDRLTTVLDYDPNTGIFKWKYFNRKMLPGSIAGTNLNGYWAVWIDGKQYAAHRLAWFYIHKIWPPKGFEIDHVNQNKSDNRISNLRIALKWQNTVNRRKRKSISCITGVSYISHKDTKNHWHAYINHEGKRTNLGYFSTKEEAMAARHAAEIIFHGEFSPVNHDADPEVSLTS